MVNFTLEKINFQSLWRGYPDPNYSWDGDVLSYERLVKDGDGKDVLVKTYKNPFEVTAAFEVGTEIYGIEGNIEKNVIEKFGGALKDFVWVDGASGGGTVTLPFTAPRIFVATGERLNPTLTEIGTDSNDDNYYEVIDNKTHVHVKGFSGVGAAAGSPPTLIAHYKMNENTAADNDELVTNGVAPADLTGWSQSPGTQWSIVVNKFQGAGNSAANYLTQDFGAVVGRKYKFSYEVTDNSLVGGTSTTQLDLASNGAFELGVLSSDVGVHTYHTKVDREAAVNNQLSLYLRGDVTGGTIDLDNISIQILAAEDSSGNDHDGLLQEDTDAAHVAGKINGAFDFDGAADYIEIADHADFTPALTPFSVKADVYMHDATNFIIASKGVYNTDGEWLFSTDGADKLRFRAFDESVADCYIGIISDDALTTYENSWIHVALTYDGGALSSGFHLRINGIEIATSADENGIFVAVENLTGVIKIGTDGTNYANGVMDNIAFFSKELTPDEDKRLDNNGHSTEILAEIDSVITPRRSNTSPLGLRARWEFP